MGPITLKLQSEILKLLLINVCPLMVIIYLSIIFIIIIMPFIIIFIKNVLENNLWPDKNFFTINVSVTIENI